MDKDFGRASEEDGDEVLALQDGLLERRDRGPLGGDEAFLLRDIERRSGADREAALNRLEYTFRRLRVVARDAQPILRPENDEVGVRDRGRGHERHHVAIEPARLDEAAVRLSHSRR